MVARGGVVIPKTITLIRHAETDANASGIWQGTSDVHLSETGQRQVRLLADRVGSLRPDLVVSSDMARTNSTAEAFGDGFDRDAGFREFAIGRWEGMTSAQIAETYPEEWRAFLAWEDVAPGGGEKLSDFAVRVRESFDRVVDRLDDGGHAVVVAHGGVIWSLVSQVLGEGTATKLLPSANTAISRIEVDDDGQRRLVTFNDATHSGTSKTRFIPTGQVATLVRHGQSEGNLTGRWHGVTDSALTDLGREQASAAAAHVPPVGRLYSSPLVRAYDTASIIGERLGSQPVVDEGLIEMSFGDWEDLSTSEIMDRFADEIATYDAGDGDDRPRGFTGESLNGVGTRMFDTVTRIADQSDGSPFVAVSHGAAIRAFALKVLDIKKAGRGKIALARNTAMSSFSVASDGVYLASYNTGPHLES